MNIKNIGMNTFTSRSSRIPNSNSVTKGFGISWIKQAFVLLALLIVSNGAWGQKSWDGGGDGVSWSSANNWNPDGVPTSTQTVSINRTTSTTINVNGDYTCASITILLSGNDNTNRTLDFIIPSGNSLTVTGALAINNTSTRDSRTKLNRVSVLGTLNAQGGIIICRRGVVRKWNSSFAI